MRAILTKHARDRCAERGISVSDVEAVVVSPSATWEDPGEASLVCSGVAADGRQLRVCLVHPPSSDGTVRVKTAFWTGG
jgi:hypothetical protein